MDNIGKYILYTVGAVAAGIGAGYAISHVLQRRVEKRIGGKLMHVNYRFSKDFDTGSES